MKKIKIKKTGKECIILSMEEYTEFIELKEKANEFKNIESMKEEIPILLSNGILKKCPFCKTIWSK